MNTKLNLYFTPEEDRAIEERIESGKRVFEGKLVKVDCMDVTLPDGKSAKREAVRHPGAAAVVAVDDQNNVLLVRQYRAAIAKALIEIPAGKLDFPGEDRLDAAKRELKEETGMSANCWIHLTDMVSSPGFCDEVIGIYLATGLSAGDVSPDEDEFLNVIKVPLGTLMAMVRSGSITDAKTLVGLLMANKVING